MSVYDPISESYPKPNFTAIFHYLITRFNPSLIYATVT